MVGPLGPVFKGKGDATPIRSPLIGRGLRLRSVVEWLRQVQHAHERSFVMSNLLRKVLLGVALATGVTGAMVMAPTPAHADFGDRFAYGHGYSTKAGAESYRASHPTAFGFRTFVKYCTFGPSGAGWYVCY